MPGTNAVAIHLRTAARMATALALLAAATWAWPQTPAGESGKAKGQDTTAISGEKASPFVVDAQRPNVVRFSPTQARFIRLRIRASHQGQPCIDELEIYGPDEKRNLALASEGGRRRPRPASPATPSTRSRISTTGGTATVIVGSPRPPATSGRRSSCPQAGRGGQGRLLPRPRGAVRDRLPRRLRGPAFAGRPAVEDGRAR